MILRELLEYLEYFAALNFQEDWDNAGLQVGDLDKEIKKIVLALDADSRALEYCVAEGADLLITHHPLLFSPIKTISSDNPEQSNVAEFIKNDIAVYSMHTNMDKVPWGTNYALADKLGLADYILEEPLFPDYSLETKEITSEFKNQFNQKVIGFISVLEYSTTKKDLKNLIVEKLGIEPRINFEGDGQVSNLAISGGSFDAEWIDKLAQMNIDTLITGEMKYHDKIACRERGISVFIIGHDISENPVLKMFQYLIDSFVNFKTVQDEDENTAVAANKLEVLEFPLINYSSIDW